MVHLGALHLNKWKYIIPFFSRLLNIMFKSTLFFIQEVTFCNYNTPNLASAHLSKIY